MSQLSQNSFHCGKKEQGTKNVVKFAQSFPSMCEALGSVSNSASLGVVAHACDPNTWEVGAGPSEFQENIASLRSAWGPWDIAKERSGGGEEKKGKRMEEGRSEVIKGDEEEREER